MLHDEPMARSENSEDSDTSASVGNARLNEMESSRKAAWGYIVDGFKFVDWKAKVVDRRKCKALYIYNCILSKA